MSINPLRKFLPAALPALLLLPAGPAHESHEPAPTGRLLCVDLGDKAACFAPGTPPEYVEEWLRRLPTYSGDRGKENFNKAARWTVTALQTSTGPQGNPAIVTWGLLPDGVNIPSGVGEAAGPSVLHAVFDAHIPSATWPAKIGQALNEWSDLSGIDYVEVAYDDGASFPISVGIDSVRPDIRIGGHSIDGRGGILAYCGYPNGGDMVIDTDDWRSYDNTGGDYLVLRNIVSHENGHGIGLGHVIPANGTKLMEPYASTAFDGPQDDDIRGGQRLYGDWLENNDDPSEPTDLGALSGAVTYENISIDKGGVDEDWFLLSAPGGGELSVTLKPVGSTYNVGPQGGSASSINTKAITDLELSIYDGSGTVVEHYQNDTGPGLDEVLSAFPLVPGDHFIRVSRVADSANAIQRYTLMVTFDVSTAVADRGELAPGPAAADLAVRPNPFNPATSIELSGAFGENRQVRIYDAAGREVNRFALSSATAGTATVRWDGTDLSGRELPSGVYFVRACGSEGETVRKALLIR